MKPNYPGLPAHTRKEFDLRRPGLVRVYDRQGECLGRFRLEKVTRTERRPNPGMHSRHRFQDEPVFIRVPVTTTEWIRI